MEQKTTFEKCLFGDIENISFDLFDVGFIAEKMLILPSIRPFFLDKAVSLCCEFCKIASFNQVLLEKSLKSPALIYRLFKNGVYRFDEIQPITMNRNSLTFCHYFRKEIEDFENIIKSKVEPMDYDLTYFGNDNDIDQLIEYGFSPSSIEYCLKYDDINVFWNIQENKPKKARWSPFEWSRKPDSLDLLSFSGFFGSIRCFKQLLLSGFAMNSMVKCQIVCSGSFDLFHLCNEVSLSISDCMCYASEFYQFSFLLYFLDNGAKINEKNTHMGNFKLIVLLFIVLQDVAILELLSIL